MSAEGLTDAVGLEARLIKRLSKAEHEFGLIEGERPFHRADGRERGGAPSLPHLLLQSSSSRRAEAPMLRGQRRPDRERIAVGILEHAVAPAVRPVARRDEDRVAGLACQTLGGLRFDAEDAYLRAEPALPEPLESLRPGHALVGVVGVQLETDSMTLERREIAVRVECRETQHPCVKRQATRDVANDEIDAESTKRAPVVRRGHPGLRLPLLHAVTARRSVVRMPTAQSGTVTTIIAAPKSKAGAGPFAASTPPHRSTRGRGVLRAASPARPPGSL